MQNETQPNPVTGNVKGLYVHVPFCDGKCFYCAFYSRPYESGLASRYLRALEIELTRLGGLKKYPRLNPETIYFGGGTPSLLSLSELGELCGIISKNISTIALKEWTVECNPRSLTADKMRVFSKAGVNRISLGAQAFNADGLQWLGRRHSVADTYEAVRMIKSAGFDNFGLDLMACIPGFHPDVWRNTLDAAMALEPKHISVYALTKEEGTRLASSVSQGHIKPLTEDEELEALAIAAKMLTQEGYQRYEVSNYAQPGFACRHNLSCWRGDEYIGLGPAAASHVALKRWTNLPDLGKYLAAVEGGKEPPRSIDLLNEIIKQMEKIVFGLRMAEGISATTAKPCRARLLVLQEEGLVESAGQRWRLTERGMNLADYVGAELLAAGKAE